MDFHDLERPLLECIGLPMPPVPSRIGQPRVQRQAAALQRDAEAFQIVKVHLVLCPPDTAFALQISIHLGPVLRAIDLDGALCGVVPIHHYKAIFHRRATSLNGFPRPAKSS